MMSLPAGNDHIVAKATVEGIGPEPAVDDVVADRANQNIGRTRGSATTTTAAGRRITYQHKPGIGRLAGARRKNVRAIGLGARIEDLRGNVAGVARRTVILIDSNEAVTNQAGRGDAGRIGGAVEHLGVDGDATGRETARKNCRVASVEAIPAERKSTSVGQGSHAKIKAGAVVRKIGRNSLYGANRKASHGSTRGKHLD